MSVERVSCFPVVPTDEANCQEEEEANHAREDNNGRLVRDIYGFVRAVLGATEDRNCAVLRVHLIRERSVVRSAVLVLDKCSKVS